MRFSAVISPVNFCVVIGMLALSACGGGGAGSYTSSAAPPPIVQTYTAPVGDAVPVGGGTAWDITGVKTTLTGTSDMPAGELYDTLQIQVTFAQDITNALPTPGTALSSPTQLGVVTTINTDNLLSTGQDGPVCGSGAGAEAGIDQGNFPSRLADGNYNIIIQSAVAGEAATSVSGNTFTQIIHLASIGVSSANVPNLSVSVGAYNGTRLASTDCFPKNGFTLVSGHTVQ